MSIEPRDSIRLQQNRQGVIDPNVTSDNLYQKALECIIWGDSPRQGLEHFWDDELKNRPAIRKLKMHGKDDLRYIRILDSFFSDTLTQPDDFRPFIFKRAMKGHRVEFLVANPFGPFGLSRAEAIRQDARSRSAEGLKRLARACNAERVAVGKPTRVTEQQISQCDIDRDWRLIAGLLDETIADLPIEIRLYDKTPSGPYYFFSDLLLAGRFWSGNSAAYYPWSQITDTPYANDLYDTMLTEYLEIWNSATPLGELLDRVDLAAEEAPGGKDAPHKVEGLRPGRARRPEAAAPARPDNVRDVFISYISSDKPVADDIRGLLEERGVKVYTFETDLRAGERWEEKVREALLKCDALIVIVSTAVVEDSEWVRAEIGAAWVNGKRLFQAKLGTGKDVLPGITGGVWKTFPIGSKGGNDALVSEVLRDQ